MDVFRVLSDVFGVDVYLVFEVVRKFLYRSCLVIIDQEITVRP